MSNSDQSHSEQNIQGWCLVTRVLYPYTNIMFIGTDLRNRSSIILCVFLRLGKGAEYVFSHCD